MIQKQVTELFNLIIIYSNTNIKTLFTLSCTCHRRNSKTVFAVCSVFLPNNNGSNFRSSVYISDILMNNHSAIMIVLNKKNINKNNNTKTVIPVFIHINFWK